MVFLLRSGEWECVTAIEEIYYYYCKKKISRDGVNDNNNIIMPVESSLRFAALQSFCLGSVASFPSHTSLAVLLRHRAGSSHASHSRGHKSIQRQGTRTPNQADGKAVPLLDLRRAVAQ